MLSDKDIKSSIYRKEIIIEPFIEENLKIASIDLTLGKNFLEYEKPIDTKSENTKTKEFETKELDLSPGQFILGITKEKVYLSSKYYGFIETRGNFARAGISVTCDDGHIDPGTNGQITLEIKNNNNQNVKINPGSLICQLFIFELSSKPEKIYEGKYSKQNKPTAFVK